MGQKCIQRVTILIGDEIDLKAKNITSDDFVENIS